MAVATCLTWMQEKKLQNCLGGKCFSLLFKASVHESSASDLLQRCRNQGPTITVIYSSDHVIVAYMSEGYDKESDSIILFIFEGTEVLKCKIKPDLPLDVYNSWTGRRYYGNSDFQINLDKREVTMNSKIVEKLTPAQCQTVSFQECEVFRCEGKLI